MNPLGREANLDAQSLRLAFPPIVLKDSLALASRL